MRFVFFLVVTATCARRAQGRDQLQQRFVVRADHPDARAIDHHRRAEERAHPVDHGGSLYEAGVCFRIVRAQGEHVLGDSADQQKHSEQNQQMMQQASDSLSGD